MRRNAGNGMNVVLHEFAHYLDGLDGEVDGTPPLEGELEKTWYRVTEAEYLRLVGSARRGEVTLLSHYGAKNRAEFFATATECFFEQPRAMQRRHAELYKVLQDFYRQDPAQWLPDADVSASSVRCGPASGAEMDPEQWQSASVDELFTIARCLFERGPVRPGRTGGLQSDPTRSIRRRIISTASLGRVHLGMFADALKDCNKALSFDPDDLEAYSTRAQRTPD